MGEECGGDDLGDEGEEGGEQVGDRQVQDEVVHPTHLQKQKDFILFPIRALGCEFTTNKCHVNQLLRFQSASRRYLYEIPSPTSEVGEGVVEKLRD